MCGIVGYVGRRRAQPLLLEAMVRLEYRGYDSCGLAVAGERLIVHKDAVRVAELSGNSPDIDGVIGIGHTRWASVGAVTRENAHPHLDCIGDIALAHNGNITNYSALKTRLEGSGHKFGSDTDSEVIAHLIEEYYHGDLAAAVIRALGEIEGSYAVVALHKNEKRLVAARRSGPLVIGLGEGENWLASDVTALLTHTGRVIYLEDGDLAAVGADSIAIFRDGKLIAPRIDVIDWLPEHASKSGYQHFMLKEIHEQPRIIRDLAGAFNSTIPGQPGLLNKETAGVLILACGTSYHAGMIAGRAIEELLGLPVNIQLASEYTPTPPTHLKKLVIGISQSGETADTLSVLRPLIQSGARVLAVTNVPGSSITRLADETLLTHAGPEISVAATKSFTAQIVALLALTLDSGRIDRQRRIGLLSELRALPAKVQQMLEHSAGVETHAKWLAGHRDAICIGRGINHPVALEAALKLKEVAYIHAEGCAAAELKHGTLALVSESMPVIAFIGSDDSRAPMLTSIREIKVRGAPVLAVAPEGDPELEQTADHVIWVPRTDALLQPVLNAVALQLLAYYTALALGLPIDTPRHLAKSVTVG